MFLHGGLTSGSDHTLPLTLPSAKKSTLVTYGLDKYGSTLRDVLLLDGTHLNQELVKDGWCWWYRKYAPDDTVLEGLELEAREAKIRIVG